MSKVEIEPKKAKTINVLDFEMSMLDDEEFIKETREKILDCHVFIFRNMMAPEMVDKIRDYLKSLGRGSLPSYHFLDEGCPDFHRVHQQDPRSYVKGTMHQFMFHPWNQNVFNLFELFKPIYHLKNLLSNLDREAFLHSTPKDGYISRLSFQFYPKGGGCIKKHSDPVHVHQICVPILLMSDYGKDYKEGGAYVVDENDEIISVDANMQKGDVVFFNAEIIHGVADIDPEEPTDWLSYLGRWMCLVSVIKTHDNNDTPNALQLED